MRIGATDGDEFDYHGSNVDLGTTAEDLHLELAKRAALQDQAFEVFRDSLLRVAVLRRDLRIAWGPALQRRQEQTGQVTVAKALAERDCRDELMELEQAEADRDHARVLLQSLQSQLTAAQTRARMWLAQWEVEHKGPR